MKCHTCGNVTRINWGDANTILCEICSDSSTGKELIEENRMKTASEFQSIGIDANISSSKSSGNTTVWAIAGGGCFFVLNIITEGAVPGGATGGAIGGAIGASLCLLVDSIRKK